MLTIDTHYNRFVLMAIDPGLNNMGVAVFTLQRSPFVILSITAETLKAEKLPDESGFDDESQSERLRKRYNLGAALRNRLELHRPDAVVSESPFFDRRKPGSFQVLTEVMTTLLDTVISYNPNTPFDYVPPLVVKKELGVAGQKGKEVVREAMAKCQPILDALVENLDDLDEHAIDGTGVGYTWLMTHFVRNKEKK